MQEWKHNRARVYIEFEDEAHAVPPPFNILWNCARVPRALYTFVRRVRQVVNTLTHAQVHRAGANARQDRRIW
jgi:hypothetical protein